jgi:hypothetical protein
VGLDLQYHAAIATGAQLVIAWRQRRREAHIHDIAAHGNDFAL